MLFIDIEGMLSNDQEEEANRFARDLLIPPPVAARLPALPKTHMAVCHLAAEIGIAPGIVVGRMQNERHITWAQLNDLKVRYQWT